MLLRGITKRLTQQVHVKTMYPSKPVNYFISRKWLCSKIYNLNCNLQGVSLDKYICKLENEFEALKNRTDAQERLLNIQPVINVLQEHKRLVDNISNLNELLQEKDEDIRTLAEEEKCAFEKKLQAIDSDLKEALLNVNNTDTCNSIVLEINAGVGGQEAMLFANELFDMYSNFAKYKGWTCEVAEYATTDLGGIRHGSLLISGDNVFKYFIYEAGVHRVQRIPATEKSGRIHTSTVSVLTLLQPSDIEIRIENKDLRIETKRASGAGGQHVNTTDSAVRITHLPTGIAVECQVDRSQIKNRQLALQRLKAKLYQEKLDKQNAELEIWKKSQVRSNFRNEKIRTYNFSQDRITDHRLHNSNVHNLKVFLQGNELLENLSNKLHSSSKVENLLRIVNELDR